MRPLTLSLGLLALGSMDASAFCGTYVGPTGVEPTNATSRIALARVGDRTTLTMANDYQGPLEDFGLLVPVPPEVTAEDVVVADPALFDTLDEYSAPRMVSYTCEQVTDTGFSTSGTPVTGASSTSSGCSGSGTAHTRGATTDAIRTGEDLGDGDLYGVSVQSVFTLGAYQFAILEADDGTGLDAWLGLHDFELPTSAQDTLQTYIDAGQKFLAARVTLDGAEDGDDVWLPPIQFAYDSPVLTLPIGLGALSSAGEQDSVVYILADAADGKYAVANYDEHVLTDECMLERDLDEWYDEQLDEGLAGGEEAAWMVEYSWKPTKCDPCSWGGALDSNTASTMGYDQGVSSAHFTRLRMRYAPEQVFEDLVFTPTFEEVNEQIRVIAHSEEVSGHFLQCAGETFAVGETCGASPQDTTTVDATTGGSPLTEDEAGTASSGCVCSVLPLGIPTGALAVMIAAARRRRLD